MQFENLDLHPDLAKGIADAGYTDCMPVQEAVFGHSFSGRDILAQSQTGTGKTAAFLVSIFNRITKDPEWQRRKALILAPTRELAVQIEEEARMLGAHLGVSMGSFYGGVGYGQQYVMLRNDVQLIIGTPGRILDLLRQGRMKLVDVGFLVIDEADRMFDMGFVDELRNVLRYLPKTGRRQTFLFSATLGLRVKDLAWEYLVEPVEIVIEPEHVTVDLVTQELHHVGSHEKFGLLLGILARDRPKSALIFCNQKNMVEEVARRLKINGIECDYIMGDLPQTRRLAIIDSLKAGRLAILVATDVAARGLDVDGLDLVVNYDVPNEAETYVHRIGRTARAGKAGRAVTLACEKFVYGLPSVEKFIGQRIPVMPFDPELVLEDRSSRMNYRHAREKAGTENSRRRGERLDRHRDPGRPRRRDGADGPEERAPVPRSAPAASGGARKDVRIPSGGVDPVRETGGRLGSGAGDGRTGSVGVPASRVPAGRPSAVPAGHAGEDPYALSQEERMRRYRERFRSGTDSVRPGFGDATAPGAGSGRAGTGPAGEREGRGGGTRTRTVPEGGSVPAREPVVRRDIVSPQSPDVAGNAAGADPGARQGLVARLRALFSRKPAR